MFTRSAKSVQLYLARIKVFITTDFNLKTNKSLYILTMDLEKDAKKIDIGDHQLSNYKVGAPPSLHQTQPQAYLLLTAFFIFPILVDATVKFYGVTGRSIWTTTVAEGPF